MLIRVILAVGDADVRRRLRRALSGPDLVIEAPRGSRHLWERTARRSGDMILATESVVPPPLASSLQAVHALPESPIIILLSDADDPEHHASLLAAGSDVVLYTGLSQGSLREALDAAVQKRQRQLQTPPTTRRPLAAPSLSDFVSESPSM